MRKATLIPAVVAASLLSACDTPEQAIAKSHGFCLQVGAQTGHNISDFPEFELGCTERGARQIMMAQRGTATSAITGMAITAAGVSLAN